MSETLIASLNQRVTELQQKNANLHAALKQARAESKSAVEESESVKGQIAALTTERDAWKQRAEAMPSDQVKRIADLEGQIRKRDHFEAFRQAASEVGVRPEAMADLYQLTGLEPPTAGEISPSLFAEPLAAAKQARGWAFASPDTGGSSGGTANNGASQGVRLGQTTPPPGAGRASADASTAPVRFTRDDVRVPGWQSKNPELATALKSGTAVLVE